MSTRPKDGTSAHGLPSELVGAAQTGWELEPGFLFLASELARCAPAVVGAERRALIFLVTALLVNQRRGSTRLPLGDTTLQRLLDDLEATPADRQAIDGLLHEARRAGGRLAPIVGAPGEHKPLLLGDDNLYVQRMHHHEERLVTSLLARMSYAGAAIDEAQVQAHFAEVLAQAPMMGGAPLRLSDEQRGAVESALRLPLAVISGGPGTGKTSIVVSILRMLVRLGIPLESVALAAPTGKAANRMAESIRGYIGAIPEPGEADRSIAARCPEPRTLHRLLGYSTRSDRFHHGERNPLTESIVIVDEASMIDLILMDRLLRALRPETRLILLGDAEQLPSVDAGAVLRDLLPPPGSEDARSAFSSRLTQSYRMDPSDPAGRNILTIARAINEGRSSSLFEGDETIRLRARVDELAFEKVELIPTEGPSALEALLERWHRERIRGLPGFAELCRREYLWTGDGFAARDLDSLGTLFRHFERQRILCVTRGDSWFTGAEAVNALVHRMAGEASGQRDPIFFPGEPVMMQRNDYGRGLFNGDQGLVLRVREEGDEGHHFRAVFPTPQGYALFHLEGLRGQLRHSYAMTVHKAQGSEFDTALLVLPESPMPLLTREILYTAVTRARRSVVIAGTREVLSAGIAQRLERHSGIGERLR